MSAGAKAVGYLDLNITGFDQALKTAKNLMVTFAAGFTAYKIADFFKDGIKDAIDFGKEMQSASRAMGGFDPGALLLTQKALEKVGMGAEEARGHIGDFITQGRNISEIFGGAEEYSRAIKSAAKDYGPTAAVLSRSGEALQAVWNTLQSIGSRTREYFLAMTEKFINPLQVVLDYLNDIHLDKKGAAFGSAIATAANTLMGLVKNGQVWETMGKAIQWAFWGGIDVLITGLAKAAAFLGAAMQSVSESFGKSLFADDMISMLQTVFKGLGSIIASMILSAASNVAKALGRDDAAYQYGEASRSESEAAKSRFEVAGMQLDEIDFGRAFEDVGKAIQAGKDAAGNVEFGQSDSGKKAGEIWEGLSKTLKFAEDTGIAMGEASRKKHAGDEKGSKDVLTSFSGSSSKVIADSLAKVGGGGGFLRAGMSLQERSAMQTAMATKQTAETLKAMHSESKKNPQKPALLPR
jgi:hypothetical protein